LLFNLPSVARRDMSRPGHSIFVIEDDPMMRDALHSLLDARGYAPRFAPTAELALLDAQCETAECLLVDVALPGMSGFDLLEALAARDPGVARRVIFMSAHDSLDLQAAAQRLGARAFLRKPFAGQVLADLIAQVIGEPTPARPTATASKAHG
jgi:FixJ family two-component response regulator